MIYVALGSLGLTALLTIALAGTIRWAMRQVQRTNQAAEHERSVLLDRLAWQAGQPWTLPERPAPEPVDEHDELVPDEALSY